MRLIVVLAVSFLTVEAAVAARAQGATAVRAPTPDAARPRGATSTEASTPDAVAPTPAKPKPDLTGRKRVGVASFYADMFAGRQMADGNIMDPHGANAASRTLPLGTTAKVTNIETGKSAIVTIQDRGPYVDGRIVDLSPGTAEKLGITRRQGLSKVVVAPIAVPLPNGEVKAGAALQEAAPELVEASPTRSPGRASRPSKPAEGPAPGTPKRVQSRDMPTPHHEVPSPPPDREPKAIRLAANQRR